MIRPTSAAVVGLFLLAIGVARAAETTPSPLSVYSIHPKIDGPVLAVSALGATVPIFLQNKIVHRQCPCDGSEVNSFDRPVIANHSVAANWASHFVVSMAIATPIYVDYRHVGYSQPFKEDMMVYAEVLSIDTSINNLFRYSVQRPRPEAYRTQATDTGSFLSFDAGHVANTVAALSAASMTYNYRHGPSPWPWVLTGTVGLSEAALRSAAGKHFYTDDILGIAVGSTVGILVPLLHHRSKAESSVMLVPDNKGAQLVWHRVF